MPSSPEHKDRPLSKLIEAYQASSAYASAGWAFAVSVAVSMALGWWLDSRIGTKPFCTVGGALLGIGVGMYNLIVIAMEIGKKDEKEPEGEKHT